MGKTILQALLDEIQYPIKTGFFENKLIDRELNPEDDFTIEVARSKSYRGAFADCIVGLILSPNITEGDINFSITYKDMMLKKANSVYQSIGEDPIDVGDKPAVYIEDL